MAAWVAQGGHHPGGAGVGAGASLPVDANAAGDRHLDDVYKPVSLSCKKVCYTSHSNIK